METKEDGRVLSWHKFEIMLGLDNNLVLIFGGISFLDSSLVKWDSSEYKHFTRNAHGMINCSLFRQAKHIYNHKTVNKSQ